MDPWLELVIDIASGISFAVGSIFLLIGALGMIRLPDVWARIHAAGIIDTIGAELIVFGMILQAGMTQASLKLILIGLFLFVTSPTATHAVANASYTAGLRPMGLRKNQSSEVLGEETRS